jgi:hypothetical protein
MKSISSFEKKPSPRFMQVMVFVELLWQYVVVISDVVVVVLEP